MSLPSADTRYLFFTGKGGVGKTSLSCATGLALAETGKRVLIVSTDQRLRAILTRAFAKFHALNRWSSASTGVKLRVI